MATAKQRRELEELERQAAVKHLRLERRERTAGAWCWDAIDTRTGIVALRGVSLADMATYIRGGGHGEES